MPQDLKQQIGDSVKKTDAVSFDEGDRAGAVAQRTVAADPVLKNELNQEPWWQSGVGLFGSGGALWSIGVLLTQVGEHGADIAAYDAGMVVTAVGSLVGFVAVLYRRFAPGLRPMFWWLAK